MGTDFFSEVYGGWNVQLATHIHKVQSSRISGIIPLFPLYAFVEWTAKTLPVLTLKKGKVVGGEG
jgi:uncharacterized membrane protein (GlpM family)